MIKAVLFDLDGLLINSEIVYFQMAKELVNLYGGSFTLEQYVKNYTGRTLDANIRSYIDLCDMPITVQEGMQWTWDREAEITANGIPLMKGAIELLDYLKSKGIKMILATSSLPDRAERILKQDGAYDYFDDFVCGPDVNRGKPDPEVFILAAQKAGEEPADCLVLEDSENGIRAANAGGFHVICVPDLKLPAKEVLDMTTAVVESLDQVIPLIEKL